MRSRSTKLATAPVALALPVLFALGGGCAQIIGANFDRPIDDGSGGAASSATTGAAGADHGPAGTGGKGAGGPGAGGGAGTGGGVTSSSNSSSSSSAGGGGGGAHECDAATDCTSIPTACHAYACVTHACVLQPSPDGGGCTDNGGHVCSSGACIPCIVDGDCGGSLHCQGGMCAGCSIDADCGADTFCAKAVCSSGTCTTAPQNDGLPIATQSAGDCQVVVCSGGSTTSQQDVTDVPDDTNPCTTAACVSGAPSFPPVMSGTSCSGGVCDGAGNCVACVDTTQCPSAPICQVATCTSNVCGTQTAPSGTACGPPAGGLCTAGACGPHHIFVTSAGSVTGSLGGTSGADTKCDHDFNNPKRATGAYKALIVDGSTRVATTLAGTANGQTNWVLKPNTLYRTTNGGDIMTTNANALFDFTTGALTNAMGVSGNDAWTGLATDWTTLAGANCTGWTNMTSGSGRFGAVGSKDANAISAGALACAGNGAVLLLICVEQ